MILRQATLADLDQALDMFTQFTAETIYGVFPLDAEKALLYISDLIRRKCAVVIEVEQSGKKIIVAALALEPMTYPFTSRPCLTQRFLYVLPSWRKTRAFNMLVDSAKDYADRAGVPLFMDHQAGGEVFLKDELFQRCGFEKIGSTFIYGK